MRLEKPIFKDSEEKEPSKQVFSRSQYAVYQILSQIKFIIKKRRMLEKKICKKRNTFL